MAGDLEAVRLAGGMLDHAPLLLALGWVVRVPLLSPTEGHEAITRAACEGMDLTDAQRAALIRGVRSPDVSIRGLAVFALPSRQPRHALRSRSSVTTAEGVSAMRAFIRAQHGHALATMDERRRWEHLGEVLHCIQDAFSPAHVDRDGARIVRMKHWGPFDRLRTRSSGLDEHGFPTDSRDHALLDGALTKEARQAATVTRDYLELVRRQLEDTDPGSAPRRAELKTFLDRWVTGPLS